MFIHHPRRSLSFILVRFSLLALVHSLIIPPVNEHTLTSLFDNLSRKSNTPYFGQRVGPSWLKYEWNQTVWNLDDGNAFPLFYHL